MTDKSLLLSIEDTSPVSTLTASALRVADPLLSALLGGYNSANIVERHSVKPLNSSMYLKTPEPDKEEGFYAGHDQDQIVCKIKLARSLIAELHPIKSISMKQLFPFLTSWSGFKYRCKAVADQCEALEQGKIDKLIEQDPVLSMSFTSLQGRVRHLNMFNN